MEWIATTGYALEGVLSREMKQLGLEVLESQTSRVRFSADWEGAARANVWLRTAGHVRLVMGQFPCKTFDELFEGTRKLPWEKLLSKDASFPVTGRSVNAQLASVPDCQSIVKRAIVERLKGKYHLEWFPENGPEFPVEVHIWKDMATLSVDTTGEPLHMRGYRTLNGPAALRETVAAALVLLSRWHPDRAFWDPCCGSGTLCIEAAMLGRNIAPGGKRAFQAEKWDTIDRTCFALAKQEAADVAQAGRALDITGTDIDPEAIRMSQFHAKQANMANTIRFQPMDVATMQPHTGYGHIVTNPPYGERMADKEQAEAMIRTLGDVYRRCENWSCHVISPHDGFERLFGARARSRRAVYNGPIACHYYQYIGPRPPWLDAKQEDDT